MGESAVLPAFTAVYDANAGSGLGLPVLPALTGAPANPPQPTDPPVNAAVDVNAANRRNRPTLLSMPAVE
jgi:hypothetical protein